MFKFLSYVAFLVIFLAFIIGKNVQALPKAIDVRIGVDGEKTRFLIEFSEKVSIETHNDPQNKSVNIVFKEPVDWAILTKTHKRIFGLVKRYFYGPQGDKKEGGKKHHFIVQSECPIEIEKIFWLKNEKNNNFRLILDLKKAKTVKIVAPKIDGHFLDGVKEIINKSNVKQSSVQQVQAVQVLGNVSQSVAVSEEMRGDHLPYNVFPLPKPKLAKDRKSFVPLQKIILIDPGHGGQDPGTISRSGVYEKNIALQMGFVLREILQKSPYYKVFMTREDDRFLRLRERLAIAKKVKADFVISLHADASPNLENRGASLYLLSDAASDTEAEALASKENKADIINGIDLSGNNQEINNILIDLAQRDTLNLAFDFAQYLRDEMMSCVKLIQKPIRFADLAVLKAPDIPSILLELGCISNKEDDRLLKMPAHRLKIAQAIKRALDRFFEFLH